MTTKLHDILVRRIRLNGPMTVADYMSECLLHPEHGYYTTREPFGSAGDFVTAPEISQMFGELIGLALRQAWMDRGAPPGALLVELGPGRGTLMNDALRALDRVSGLELSPWLIEASPRLREVQAQTLQGRAIHWADTLDDLPEGPVFAIANEFFDALPVRQFLRDGPAWRERVIGRQKDQLAFGLSAPTEFAGLEPFLRGTDDGDLVQICAPANGLMTQLADRIAHSGGAALVIDYGSDSPLGDTLQAVRAHEKCSPLDRPGQADLTAHVDFAALAHAATSAGAVASDRIPQGVFLELLGISARATQLAQHLPPTQSETVIAAHRRLTHPAEMGNLFKVLGVTAPGDAPIPGTQMPHDPERPTRDPSHSPLGR